MMIQVIMIFFMSIIFFLFSLSLCIVKPDFSEKRGISSQVSLMLFASWLAQLTPLISRRCFMKYMMSIKTDWPSLVLLSVIPFYTLDMINVSCFTLFLIKPVLLCILRLLICKESEEIKYSVSPLIESIEGSVAWVYTISCILYECKKRWYYERCLAVGCVDSSKENEVENQSWLHSSFSVCLSWRMLH
jgi:hypothetical protein